jgi:hypothetical protein
LGEVAVVDLLADGSLVGDEVLALVAGGSAGVLGPLGGDGGNNESVGCVGVWPLPVVACDPVGDEVDIVLLSSSGHADSCADSRSAREGSRDARSCNARSSAAGIARPRFPARLKIPAAACGLKENLAAHAATSTSGKDVDTPPPLGYSEESAVQNSVGEVVKPEVGQRRENDREVPSRSVDSSFLISSRAGKESGYVLDEDVASWSNKFIGESGELVEEAGSLTLEAGATTGDAEVLAGEPSAEEVDMR